MKVPVEVLKKMGGLYGPTDRMVYGYSNGLHLMYLALRPEKPVPVTHPLSDKHLLVGKIDLETGEIGEEVQTPPKTDRTMTVVRILGWAVAITKGVLVLILVLIAALIQIVLFVTGSRR